MASSGTVILVVLVVTVRLVEVRDFFVKICILFEDIKVFEVVNRSANSMVGGWLVSLLFGS